MKSVDVLDAIAAMGPIWEAVDQLREEYEALEADGIRMSKELRAQAAAAHAFRVVQTFLAQVSGGTPVCPCGSLLWPSGDCPTCDRDRILTREEGRRESP